MSRPVLPLESVPRDCWDWITPDDVVRHALAAYYAASRAVSDSRGELWFDGGPWSDRAMFRDTLAGLFKQRVCVQAFDLGIRNGSGVMWRDLPEGLRWDEPGAGRSPADMAHGCAALDLAVGPAQVGASEASVKRAGSEDDITTPVNPLLLASSVQELPTAGTITTPEANP